MWYPLKNSVYALSAASVVLAALLVLSKPAATSQPEAALAPHEEHPLVVAADTAAKHLTFEKAHEKALTALILHVAAKAMVAELEAKTPTATFERVDSISRHGRRQTAMPFFSFADLLPRAAEPGS